MIKELTALTLTILVSSTVGLTTLNFNSSDQVNEYVSIIEEAGEGYQHTLDDLCGMMEIAQKFRDDPDYNYDPSDMDYIIMRDGVNGTEELIDAYNELINTTIRQIESESAN